MKITSLCMLHHPVNLMRESQTIRLEYKIYKRVFMVICNLKIIMDNQL